MKWIELEQIDKLVQRDLILITKWNYDKQTIV